MVIYNNDVSWEELQRVLDEGCFDSGALAGLLEVVARAAPWRRADLLSHRRSRDIPGAGHARVR